MIPRRPRARWIAFATSSVVTLSLVSHAFGQAAVVLGVVPEGVVIDAATLPDLQAGAKLGFRRADGSAAQIGEGSVLDVRDGRALVELRPGGTVQAGDLAVACASLTGSGSQADLRVSLQGLKTQLPSSGGGSAEVQAAIAQLESMLDAREAAIRAGSCDVSAQDQQIAALTQQLQQLLVASAPSAPSLPPSSAGVPPLPLPPGSVPGGSPGQETVGASSLPGAPPTVGQSAPSEGFAAALQFAQQLFQMAQSMGLGGSKGSGGQQPVSTFPPADVPVPVGATPPLDPGAGQGSQSFVPPPPPPPVTAMPTQPPPPVVSTPPSPPPSVTTPPSPPPVTTPPSPPPPPVVSTPPKPQPPTPRIVLDPSRLRLPGDRPVDAPPVPGKSSETPGDPRKPQERPSGQWWTIPQPKQSPAVAGTTPSTPSGSLPRVTVPGATRRSETAPAAGTSKPLQAGTSLPALTLPPGSAGQPVAGSIARGTSPSHRVAVVQGFVRTDNGVPVPAAVIAVGGKQVATNARGQFVVNDVPLGRQLLVVTARGFQPGRMPLEVSSGEVEKVTVTLRHARSLSPLQSP